MKLLQRVGYYLGGFSLGLVVLAFFLSGKKTSCAYGMDARVIKNINTKNIQYSENVKLAISNNKIDSISIRQILINGDVNFSESDQHKKPCALYTIEGYLDKKDVFLNVENCDSIATVKSVKWQ